MTTPEFASIAHTCQAMRRDIIEMVGGAGSGHPGGSLSAVEIVATLYGEIMRHDPADPALPARDRFVLSKGHAAPVLYAALAEHGYFPREELATLRKLGSRLQGHPDMRKLPGVEVSTGSLGQGLALANGIALSLRLDGVEKDGPTVFCLMGDGECQEGEVWEAAMAAAHWGLSNVVAIVDVNGLQIDGPTCEVMDLGSIAEKFSAFGWNVITADGHNVRDLVDALRRAKAFDNGPVVVVARTMKGKGVSFMENLCDWHGKAPNADECAAALAELSEGSN
ncbi:MAG: transketolase [Coriobacteriia bacterium]|nr:transketolase [Coriobacteriia bacterium]